MALPAGSLIPVLLSLALGVATGGAVGLALQDRASAEWKQRWHDDTAALTERAQRAERGQVDACEATRSAVAESNRLKAVVVQQAREIDELRTAVEPRYADFDAGMVDEVEADIAPPMPISIR